MSTNITILELQKMLGIRDKVKWRQIWKDAMAIYEASITQVEFNAQSWANLSKSLQDAMIVKVTTFLLI